MREEEKSDLVCRVAVTLCQGDQHSDERPYRQRQESLKSWFCT